MLKYDGCDAAHDHTKVRRPDRCGGDNGAATLEGVMGALEHISEGLAERPRAHQIIIYS